jgi:hypothetical protein
MEITNIHGLPETLVAACKLNNYSKGKSDYSVTEIMSPPRIQRLRQAHYKDMKQDVVDMLWSVMGTAIHTMMERTDLKGHTKEERIYYEIDGVVLSGAIDLQTEKDGSVEITDYKFTSAWALRADKIEWIQQQNIYAWLIHKTSGKKIHGLRICAIIRDWSRREAMNNPNYPQGNAQIVHIPLWDFDKTEAYVRERLELHRLAKVQADWGEELPLCTDDDRWVRETKYAVKKEGRKTAVRVFDTEDEAQALLAEMPPKDKGFIEIRAGEPVRCTGNFCGVAKWCSQFKQENENGMD